VDTDPEPYLFEPEYTDEELQVLDAERARREAESSEAAEQQGAEGRWRSGEDWRCSCGACQPMPTEVKSFCCTEWDLVLPLLGRLEIYHHHHHHHQEKNHHRECITRSENFAAITNPGVIETFFSCS